jgi:transcription antitermination protein NusB
VDIAGRRRAREAALQMLYQSEIGRTSADEVIGTFWSARDPPHEIGDDHRAFAEALVRGTLDRLEEIDRYLSARAVNWRIERMAVIDRQILRLAICEMLTQPATPARVVLNEAIELARTFSGDESVPFVNGVLDGVKKDLGRD